MWGFQSRPIWLQSLSSVITSLSPRGGESSDPKLQLWELHCLFWALGKILLKQPVMVILCVSLTGSQRAGIWSNIIPVKLDSEPGGEGVLNEINIWISSLSSRLPFPTWVGFIQSTEDQNRTESRPLLLIRRHSPLLQPSSSWMSCLLFLCTWLKQQPA